MARAARETRSRKREHDPGHQGGKAQFPRNQAEVRGHEVHQLRGKDHAQQDQAPHQQRGAHDDVVGQAPGPLRAQLLVIVGEHGDEGRTQGPFGKEVPQQVGDAEGHHKGVVGQAGPEQAGEHLFPHQPENPAGKDGKAHRPGSPGDLAGLAGWFLAQRQDLARRDKAIPAIIMA